MGELDGRRVLVTGASSGIGEGTARELAAAGARVACVARRKERIEALAEAIEGFAVEADVTDEAAARRAVDEAAESLGGLDAVLNIAGVQLLAPFSDGRSDEWRTLLDVNVFGLCVVTHQSLRYLREAGGGDIVNMSSIAGRRVTGGDGAVYSGTKFAVHAISEAIRRELHGEGIRVMIVSPGWANTELGQNMQDEEILERLQERQEEIGLDPREIGRQIVHALAQPRHLMLHEITIMSIDED
jgi:NADP-dependent 3-hydroxy acid dehydrogenase YdfG